MTASGLHTGQLSGTRYGDSVDKYFDLSKKNPDGYLTGVKYLPQARDHILGYLDT